MDIVFFILIAFVPSILPVGLWIAAERKGKPWQRYVAGLVMAIWFAACGAVVTGSHLTLKAFADGLETNYRLNHASQEMLTAAIRRMEAGECEELVGEFRWMWHKIGHPKTDRPMIEEPFTAFAEGRASDFP